jgi:hypothetical protein
MGPWHELPLQKEGVAPALEEVLADFGWQDDLLSREHLQVGNHRTLGHGEDLSAASPAACCLALR